MKKRCCIIGAAPIANYNRVSSYLRDTDYMIYCDGGLFHEIPLGRPADLIIGDFDSYSRQDFSCETIVLPHEKDDTDTFYAAKEALLRGYDHILIIGCAGLRLDHTLGNLSMLLMLHKKGARALMLDDYSEMEIVGKNPVTVSPDFPYFSLLNIEGTAKGVCVEDALYELKNHTISPDFPLGVSNEPLPGKDSVIRVKEGHLLLLRIFDI